MLSNIFLHEVLDTWFANVVKPRLKGRAFMIRYADDFDSLPPPFPLALRVLLRRIKRKTAHKRLSRSLKAIGQWMRKHLHWPIREQWGKLKQKLSGHYGYYGITGNAACLEQYYDAVKRLWHKWLNRRSRQRGSMKWESSGDGRLYPEDCLTMQSHRSASQIRQAQFLRFRGDGLRHYFGAKVVL